MKKIRTVLALAVLVPMLSACGPSPEDVCEHVMGVMKKELGEALTMTEQDMQEFRNDCVENFNAEQAKMGSEEFAKRATCVIGAKNFHALEKCDKLK